MGVGLPSMAPQPLAWGWFEPSSWLEVFLEDRTHTNVVASGVGDEVTAQGKKGVSKSSRQTLVGSLALPLTS